MARLILALLLAGCGGAEENHPQSAPQTHCSAFEAVKCNQAAACAPEQRNCK